MPAFSSFSHHLLLFSLCFVVHNSTVLSYVRNELSLSLSLCMHACVCAWVVKTVFTNNGISLSQTLISYVIHYGWFSFAIDTKKSNGQRVILKWRKKIRNTRRAEHKNPLHILTHLILLYITHGLLVCIHTIHIIAILLWPLKITHEQNQWIIK